MARKWTATRRTKSRPSMSRWDSRLERGVGVAYHPQAQRAANKEAGKQRSHVSKQIQKRLLLSCTRKPSMATAGFRASCEKRPGFDRMTR